MKTEKMTRNFKNKLLKRNEVEIETSASKNPGFQNSLKLVSEEMKAPEDRIVVKAVRSQFGNNKFVIESFVYDSKEDKEKIEPKKKEKKPANEQEAGGKK